MSQTPFPSPAPRPLQPTEESLTKILQILNAAIGTGGALKVLGSGGGGGGAAWGAITGTLSDQTDLQSALDALQGGKLVEIQLAASDETTAITAGTSKVIFRAPCAFTLTGVRASLSTAQASGDIFTVDINKAGTSVLGTKLTIDNAEKTSTTATTAATITTPTIEDDAEISVDVDQIGNGTATGLKVTLLGTRA